MREIDDPHDPEDQAETSGNEEEHRGIEQRVQDLNRQEGHPVLLRLGAYDATLDPDARSPRRSGTPKLPRTAGSRVTVTQLRAIIADKSPSRPFARARGDFTEVTSPSSPDHLRPGGLDPVRRRGRLVVGRAGLRPAERGGDVPDRKGEDRGRTPACDLIIGR